ncbi:MAG: hypothetical protein HY290_08190 [Planctomycetia bacterium]|nr:hypothetical protein [Planctomycetia bacterium]
MQEFKSSVEAAVRLLSEQKGIDKSPQWLNERALAGIAEAGLETLPADLGFPLGAAAGRFRRIAQEVAEADGVVEREQSEEAAASLKRIAEILRSLPGEFWNSPQAVEHRRAS